MRSEQAKDRFIARYNRLSSQASSALRIVSAFHISLVDFRYDQKDDPAPETSTVAGLGSARYIGCFLTLINDDEVGEVTNIPTELAILVWYFVPYQRDIPLRFFIFNHCQSDGVVNSKLALSPAMTYSREPVFSTFSKINSDVAASFGSILPTTSPSNTM